MPFVVWPQQLLGFKIKKRLGLPNMFGWLIYGWGQYGDDNIFSGLYQQRRRRIGNGKNEPIIFGKIKNFVQRPQWPIQPPSAARDFVQSSFSVALSMWQALTPSQKNVYNTIATRRSKRGYDLFMSQTLKSLLKVD